MGATTYRHPRPLQAGEVITVTLKTPRTPHMNRSKVGLHARARHDQADGRREARRAEDVGRTGSQTPGFGRPPTDYRLMPDPSSLVANPFAALTAVAGPAVLTNACSVLALGTSNRLARVVDRTRVVTHQLAERKPGTTEYESLARQRTRLAVRSHLLLRALRATYAALGGFASAALLMVVGFRARGLPPAGCRLRARGGVGTGCRRRGRDWPGVRLRPDGA